MTWMNSMSKANKCVIMKYELRKGDKIILEYFFFCSELHYDMFHLEFCEKSLGNFGLKCLAPLSEF